jgi:hypothetical protein
MPNFQETFFVKTAREKSSQPQRDLVRGRLEMRRALAPSTF